MGWVNAEAGYPLAGAAEEDGVIQPAQFVHSFVLVSARAYRYAREGAKRRAGHELELVLREAFRFRAYAFNSFSSASVNPSHAKGNSALFWKRGSSATG